MRIEMTQPPLWGGPTTPREQLRHLQFQLRTQKFFMCSTSLLFVFLVIYEWKTLGIVPIVCFALGYGYSRAIEGRKEKKKEVLRLKLIVNPGLDK